MLFIAITHLLFPHDYVVDSLIAAATIRGRCLYISFDMYVGADTTVISDFFVGKIFSFLEESPEIIYANIFIHIIIFIHALACKLFSSN